MLYNPRWEQKTDTFTLEGLISWLEKQPRETEYKFYDCDGNCLIAQYLRAQGLNWQDNYRKFRNEKTRAAIAGMIPQTFGAALDRARVLWVAS